MANVFIASGKGFLKSYVNLFASDRRVPPDYEFEWTQNLMYAMSFESTKHAKIFKNKIDSECFIYNPYIEEPIKNRYKVVRRSHFHDIYDETDHEVLEYMVLPIRCENNSDVSFLNTKSLKIYHDLDEANKICNELNEKILNDLLNKMNKK